MRRGSRRLLVVRHAKAAYPDGVADFDVAGGLRARIDRDVRVDNDATCAALAEWRLGAGRGSDDMILVTLGTGIGGEGSPEEVLVARGLGVVSDDGALLAAIDEVLAAQPDVADRIRGGRLQAVGAIVGGVMKATRGQADASVVRRLLLERLGVEEQ